MHTSNKGIHARFGPCGGDVAITTPVFYCFPPQTDVDRFLHQWFLHNFYLHFHIHFLLLFNFLLNWCHRGGWGVLFLILRTAGVEAAPLHRPPNRSSQTGPSPVPPAHGLSLLYELLQITKCTCILISLMSSTCVPFKALHSICCIFDVFDMNSYSTVFI